MRGTLSPMDQLQQAIEKIAARRMGKIKVEIPAWALPRDLAWDFEGKVKYLEDCNKDELLYVCQILCEQIKSIEPVFSPALDHIPSAA